jgi:hypothetical protein
MRRQVRLRSFAPPRILTFEEISRPSGNCRPIGRLVGVSFVSAGVSMNLSGMFRRRCSLRTKFGFAETETPVRRDKVRMRSRWRPAGENGAAARPV